jgi:hypothetical protein
MNTQQQDHRSRTAADDVPADLGHCFNGIHSFWKRPRKSRGEKLKNHHVRKVAPRVTEGRRTRQANVFVREWLDTDRVTQRPQRDTQSQWPPAFTR